MFAVQSDAKLRPDQTSYFPSTPFYGNFDFFLRLRPVTYDAWWCIRLDLPFLKRNEIVFIHRQITPLIEALDPLRRQCANIKVDVMCVSVTYCRVKPICDIRFDYTGQ